MRISLFILISTLIISCSRGNDKNASSQQQQQYPWEELVDSNLSKWDNYLSFKHKNTYNGQPPRDKKGELITPIGLNNDSYNVFSTFQEADQTVLRISGEYYGCLITKNEYHNYHLQLKYKWGNKKWQPRKDKLRDSGILYHSIGPLGAEFFRSWMLSQEFQIMEGYTGDYWSQATSGIDIRAYQPESNLNPLAHESQDYLPISMKSKYKNYCMRKSNHENRNGEWNTLDLYCFEDKSLHVVNGKVVMILQNSRYSDENEQIVPLIKGKIQIQSEAAEVFFKAIRIRSLSTLSNEQLSLF